MNAAAQQHQRVEGEAHLEFKQTRRGTTALADLYQRAPCRVLFPATEAGDPPQAVLLTTSGGLTGGDRTRVSVAFGPDSQATVTTQAAEKIYRALDMTGDAFVQVDLRVGAGAWAEWLAQETILFDGSRLRRRLTADIAAEGRLLAVESVVLGRTAMGESFDSGLLHDAWRIRRGGRLIWADALHLSGDVKRSRTAPFGFGTCVACSTVLYAGPDSAQQLSVARRVLDGLGPSGCEGDVARGKDPGMRRAGYAASPNPGPIVSAQQGRALAPRVTGGATLFDGLLIIRVVGTETSAVRALTMSLAAEIRHSAAGLPARLPRVWHC
jgi:urease accessory protein